MDLAAFRASLAGSEPPALEAPLRALWWDAKGDWGRAHGCVDSDESSREAAWVHAYLHRREGDLGNAGYWYRRAGRPVATGSLGAEWQAIAGALLDAGGDADA